MSSFPEDLNCPLSSVYFLPSADHHPRACSAGNFLMYFVVSLAYNAICVTCNSPTNPYWVMEGQLSDPTFYLVCFLTPAVALLPRFEQRVLFPS